jgi:membrane protein YdbS with pleckstrin-like domain
VAFELRAMQRYAPPCSPGALRLALALFMLLLAATSVFLWNAHLMNLWQRAGAAALIVVGLWGVGHLGETPPGLPRVAGIL